MTSETLYLFLALAVLTGVATWLNMKSVGFFLSLVTLSAVLLGLAGMVALVGATLFGWDLGGAL